MCVNLTLSEELIDVILSALSAKRESLLNFVVITKNADNDAISNEYVKCIEAQNELRNAKFTIERQKIMMAKIQNIVRCEEKQISTEKFAI